MTLNVREYIRKTLSTHEIEALVMQLGIDLREILLDTLEAYGDNTLLRELERMSYDVDVLWKQV